MRVLADRGATAAAQEIKVGALVRAHDMLVVEHGVTAFGGRDAGLPCGKAAGEFFVADVQMQAAVGDIEFDHVAVLHHGEGAAGRRYGAYAMEVLINDLLKHGARRDRLEAKLFGGGRMFDSMNDIGRANADFAERFLRDEGIALVGGSLRGLGGRRVQFWPVSGRALVRGVEGAVNEKPVVTPEPGATGVLELF